MSAHRDTGQPRSKSVRVVARRLLKHGGIAYQPGQTLTMFDSPALEALERGGVLHRQDVAPAPDTLAPAVADPDGQEGADDET